MGFLVQARVTPVASLDERRCVKHKQRAGSREALRQAQTSTVCDVGGGMIVHTQGMMLKRVAGSLCHCDASVSRCTTRVHLAPGFPDADARALKASRTSMAASTSLVLRM